MAKKKAASKAASKSPAAKPAPAADKSAAAELAVRIAELEAENQHLRGQLNFYQRKDNHGAHKQGIPPVPEPIASAGAGK